MSVFILAVGIGLIFFYVVAQKTIDSSSQERMKTNVARQSEHLRTILNIHYSYLEGVAEKIQDEFYRIYASNDLQQLKRFHQQLDIIAEGYCAQAVTSEGWDQNL